MTTDRKLLELAAKAAGTPLIPFEDTPMLDIEGQPYWNPLTDDGDALRLAVKLGLGMHIDNIDRFVVVENEQIFYDETKFGGGSDPYAATRRAIVRAAADIGRTK